MKLHIMDNTTNTRVTSLDIRFEEVPLYTRGSRIILDGYGEKDVKEVVSQTYYPALEFLYISIIDLCTSKDFYRVKK